MKARAMQGFTASANGRRFACKAGELIEADKATVLNMEAIGLVKATGPSRRAAKPRKAGKK